jgi:hypothetical protein
MVFGFAHQASEDAMKSPQKEAAEAEAARQNKNSSV